MEEFLKPKQELIVYTHMFINADPLCGLRVHLKSVLWIFVCETT